MLFNVQYATMSPVLPFDITALIIDIVGENNDTDLLKELSLVSHSFHQDCSKHLFSTVELHDATNYGRRSSKKGFIKLVKSRPNVVKYIRKVHYKWSIKNDDDHLLSPIFSNFLPTTSRLNCLEIDGACQTFDWNTLDSSLISAFLHLMCLPTINHIDLTFIHNFPLSSLTRSVNLHQLGIFHLSFDQPEIVVESEMPKIRELRTSHSHWVRGQYKLFNAKTQDGRPAFNFMDLRQFRTYLWEPEDERNVRYLLQNAKLLEKLHIDVENRGSLVGLHDSLSPVAPTLKVLRLWPSLSLAGLYEELEAMAGHYTLEALSIIFDHDSQNDGEASILGSNIQKVGRVLVRPGWSTLRRVFFTVRGSYSGLTDREKLSMSETLQCLPDKYLSHLSKLDSISFHYSLADSKYFEPDNFLF